MDLNALAAEIHQINVDHGFYEKPPTFGDRAALILSELAEAMEEYRKFGENPEMMVYYSCNMNSDLDLEVLLEVSEKCPPSSDSLECICHNECGKYGKPEGIATELIDACIRILDNLADDKVNIHTLPHGHIPPYYELTFGEFITELSKLICEAYTVRRIDISRDYYLFNCFETIYAYLTSKNIKPYDVMRLKIEYNKTRPYKHGKLL